MLACLHFLMYPKTIITKFKVAITSETAHHFGVVQTNYCHFYLEPSLYRKICYSLQDMIWRRQYFPASWQTYVRPRLCDHLRCSRSLQMRKVLFWRWKSFWEFEFFAENYVGKFLGGKKEPPVWNIHSRSN